MATASGQTVCLCMIVKDEAPVIRRCLDSVRPLIDRWIIVDTGSTDGTQDVVREHFRDVPGRLVERPWRDFAHNRSEALALARPEADYSLVIDADDNLELPGGYRLPELDADSYSVDILFGTTRYHRPQLVRSALPWRYDGVIHEYLACEEARSSGHLPILMRINQDGARRRDPGTFKRDAAVLERAVAEEADPFKLSRYTFYLAQSYRDSGEAAKAVPLYLRRAGMGFWEQEVYVALLQAGRLQHALGEPFATVLDAYERATAACPSRAEALFEASRLCRSVGENARGAAYGKAAMALPEPPLALFSEAWVYEWGARDEYIVNSYWAGDPAGALDAALEGLAGGALPEAQRARFLANARHAAAKLRESGGVAVSAQAPAAAHALAPPRDLQVVLPSPVPRVLVAILAKQKEAVLPLYLECIEALDYPKSSIVLYIRTNNNTDRTRAILEDWIGRVRPHYAAVEFDGEDIEAPVERFGVHEWNAVRFRALAHIRNVSLARTSAHGCDFYFTADCDNFVRPSTLRNLVALDMPIVSPLLRHVDERSMYSNYHAAVDENGYFRDSDVYQPVLYRAITGSIEMPVVHCTYAVRADVIPKLGYSDDTERHEYVVFSDRARRNRIPQYLDNRELYGYLTLDDGEPALVGPQLEKIRTSLANAAQGLANAPGEPRTLLFCTSFADDRETWETRYRRWVDYVRSSRVAFDRLVIFDDGSPILPDWPDASVIAPGAADDGSKPVLIVHFPDRLGRHAVFDFPGWYRSFTEAGKFATRGGYTKAVHVESDSFLISDDIQGYVNDTRTGWTAFWVNRFGYAESALQVIGHDQMQAFADLREALPHESIVGREYEKQLPFTRIERRFLGDRYGEYLPTVPSGADYVVSARMREDDAYYWWLGRQPGSGGDPRGEAERWHGLADNHFGDDHAAALEAFLRRSERSRWGEDRFLALLKAGSALERRGGASLDDVLDLYARATKAAPHRAEAIHRASRACFAGGANRRGYEIAKAGLHLRPPADGMQVEGWVYEYGLYDQYALNAYWSGQLRDCALAYIDMLTQRDVPRDHKQRMQDNVRLVLDKLLA